MPAGARFANPNQMGGWRLRGPGPRLMGVRPGQPLNYPGAGGRGNLGNLPGDGQNVGNLPDVDSSHYAMPACPVQFYPYPPGPLLPAWYYSQAASEGDKEEEGQASETQDPDQNAAGESKVKGRPGQGRGRGHPGRPSREGVRNWMRQNAYAGGAIGGMQQAAASHWLIWSWLTQLHDNYDITITLSMKSESEPSGGGDQNEANSDRSEAQSVEENQLAAESVAETSKKNNSKKDE